MVKKPKFNLMDCLIILVVAAAIAGGVYILGSLKDGGTAGGGAGQVGVRYKAEIANMDESFAQAVIKAVENGGKCVVGEKEGTEAVIKKVDYAPTEIFTNNLETGAVHWEDSLNKYTVNIVIESVGTETETSITAGTDEALKVGRTIAVRGKGFAGYACVLEIETFDVEDLGKEAE